ncbi:methyltransferase domain-containing protein [Leucobacter zeae]|nr:methyltransferase domain-containing protein [Leucobacter zeae]
MGAAEEFRFDDLFAGLSREPDFDAPELQAYDAADGLILETAADAVREAEPGTVVVVGDRHGALTLGAAGVLGAAGIRTHQDPLLGERALARNAERLGLAESYASLPLGPELLSGARVVLLQLPRGLDALDEIAWEIARWSDPSVRVFAGGRVKHMTLAMNHVFARAFARVSAGLGKRKSRVLTVSDPVPSPGAPPFPKWGNDAALPFRVAAFGATFGGPTLDHGSRLLLAGLIPSEDVGGGAGSVRVSPRPEPEGPAAAPRRIVDLGCGNGVLAVSAAIAFPEAAVIATDQSAAAVAATRLTAEAAGVPDRVAVHRADALEAVPDGWADLILLNPPFHTGATVHAGVAHRLIRACGRALAPGGELRIVFNSHLAYRPLVEQVVGETRQVARDRTFTVLSAIRG